MFTKSIALGVIAAVLAATAVAPGPAHAVTRALVQGSGSTWAANAINQWVADLDAEGLKVIYTANGSTQGRRNYAERVTDFGVSDLPYQGTDELGQPDDSGGRELAYVPIAGGGIAFAYRLVVDGQRVRDLRLSSATLAGIFTGRITAWDDPAVTADNNGRELPIVPIVPVVNSEGAGSTAQLTAWLDATHPDVWRPYLGRSGWTSRFPATGGMVSGAGSGDVLDQVQAGDGAIGYVENAYPHLGNVPVAKVRNASGHFVAPTGWSTAIGLRAATLDDQGRPVLDGVYTNPDPRAYPIPSYASLILPTGATDLRMTTAKRQSLAELTHHALCAGQSISAPIGYAPLPLALVRPGLDQLERLQQADPAVDLTGLDLASCTGNPTFDPADPSRDLLDESVPMPPACDRAISGPCGHLSGADLWPRLVGTPRVGDTLRAHPGAWSGPGPYDHQWLADGRPLSGATGAAYAVPASLLGRQLSVRVTTRGVPAVAEDTTEPVRVIPGRLTLARPRITGRAVVGRRLSVRPDATAGARIRVRWYAGGRVVRGERRTTLRPTTRMRGKRITVLVTVSKPGYATLAKTSRATRPVRRTTRRG